MKSTLPLLACTGMLMTTPAFANGDWIVGLLVNGDQSAYVGGKDSTELLPYFAYETDRLHIGIDEISYEVINRGNLELSVMVDPRFADDLPDTALFEGLTRETAFEAGFSARYAFGAASANLSLQHDVSGVHNGLAGTLSFGYEAQLGPLELDLTAGVKIQDANLNNYLYGMRAADAKAGRAAFEMDNTANAFVELTAIMPISDNMFLLGEVSYTDLGQATNSPLVDRNNRTDVLIGLLYQF